MYIKDWECPLRLHPALLLLFQRFVIHAGIREFIDLRIADGGDFLLDSPLRWLYTAVLQDMRLNEAFSNK